MLSRVKFFIGLAAFTTVVRLLPYVFTHYDVTVDPTVVFYPWNFVSLTAMCLYAGAYCSDRRLAFGLPLLTVFVSDLCIGLLTGHIEWAFPPDRWAAYLTYPVIILMGTGLNRQPWPLRGFEVLIRGFVAELLFFMVTNFAYFLVQTSLPHTTAGLITCYIQAIPFAGKAFASTAIFSVMLVSPLAIRAAGGAMTETALDPSYVARRSAS